MKEIDTTKIGVIAARSMEWIEKLLEDGTIKENSRVGAVSIVVAIDRDTPEEELQNPLQIPVQTFTFCITEPQEVYIQTGLLRMALDNTMLWGDDDEDED